MQNEVKGLSLFNDVEDAELRTRNRAVVMANVAEANTKKGKITPRAAHVLLTYFEAIPLEEREPLHKAFEKQMKERGYVRS